MFGYIYIYIKVINIASKEDIGLRAKKISVSKVPIPDVHKIHIFAC